MKPIYTLINNLYFFTYKMYKICRHVKISNNYLEGETNEFGKEFNNDCAICSP